jgi:ATP-binding cassette subfamily B (MDR/TAP) protein 1
MMEVIEREPEIDGLSSAGTIPSTPATGNIQIRDVFFSYPSRPHIKTCNGFNLDIKSGETVALVGQSGCGKSTIINLLLRFYDPQSGQILLDGHSLSDLNLRWLRGVCGYVGQEPCLFSGSIFDNIAYGLDSVLVEQGMCERNAELKEKVIAAAKKSNAHDFISTFPQGYDTDVGSGGIQMSG